MEPISVKGILHSPRGVLFAKNPRQEWELPGGRPDAGEGLEAALIRELEEECGLAITSTTYVGSQSCEIVPNKRVLLVFFRCEYTDAQMQLSEEHTDYRWVDLAGERPPQLPEFYWKACLAACPRAAKSDNAEVTYPLPTGVLDRQRLRLTSAIYDTATTEFLRRYLPNSGRILEVGCGHGQIARWMAINSPDATVLALDISPEQVALACSFQPLPDNLLIREGDATRLEEGGNFDLIVCRFVLLHIADRGLVIQALLSRLSPTGILLIEEPSLSSLFSIPSLPAFEQANAAILAYGRAQGIDYDCAESIWPLVTALDVDIREARFSQPTVWSEEHKQIVRLSFQAFRSKLVEFGFLEARQAEQISESLAGEYATDVVISGGLRTLQLAVSRRRIQS